MKKQVIACGCCYRPENLSLGHEWYAVTITRSMLRRFRKLAEWLKEESLFSCEFFDYSVRVYDGPQKAPKDAFFPDPDDGEADVEGDGQEHSRAECVCCVVMQDSVKWTWIPKYADSSQQCSTHSIMFGDLNRELVK